MLKTFLGTFLLLFNLLAYSQPFEYRFHSYGPNDGLPSGVINGMAEDNYGFIWVGTDNGLCRFDAYKFKTYKDFDKGVGKSGVTQINALLVMPDSNLLVGTSKGLFQFNSKTETFTNILKTHNLGPIYVSEMVLGDKQDLWVATDNGLYLYNQDNGDLKHFMSDIADNTSLSNASIFDLLFDSKGRLWISTLGGGLNLYRSEAEGFKSFENNPSDNASISSNTLRELLELPDGNILIGTESDGFNLLNPETSRFKRFNYDPDDPSSLSSTSAYSFLLDHNEDLWVGTWANGLNLFDLENSKSRRFVNNPDELFSLSDNVIRCMMQSSTGDIWFGTDGGGLNRLNLNEQRIVRYRHNSRNENSLSSNFVRSVYEDDNSKLWIGTGQAGLNYYDPSLEKFSVYLKPDGTRDGLARGTVWSISPGDNNILWLGTSRGIAKFNKKTEAITFYEPDDNDPTSISSNNVLKVLDDGKGSLWAGMWYGGLNRMDIETGEFHHFNHDSEDSTSLASNNVNELYIDSKQRLWVGSDRALSLLLPDGKSFKNYEMAVVMINEDQQGDLWVCSQNGLLKFNPDLEGFHFLGEKDGFASDFVNSILIDEEGTIWAGSDMGIDQYYPETGAVSHYSKADGLTGNDLMSRACTLGSSGNIYFGGVEGLSQIDPEKLNNNAEELNLHFTDLLLFNKKVAVGDTTVLKQSVHTLERLTLDYTDYIFAFEFSGFNFHQPENVKYQYTLSNFDKEWISTDHTNRKAVYTNVPSGDYTLRIRATGKHGTDPIAENSIAITIIPPWWKTWWANALLYGGIILIGLAAFQIRVSVIRSRQRVLEEEVALRTREVIKQKKEIESQANRLEELNEQKDKLFSIVAHDLRNPLATLRGTMTLLDPKILQEEELEEIRTDIGEKIDNLSATIINLLDWAKGQMEGELMVSESIDIHKLINKKVDLFSEPAMEKGVKITNEVPAGTTVHADLNQIKSIFRNLIGNALKFTGDGDTIDISAITNKEEVIINIRDSGLGMDEDKLESLFSIATNTSTKGTAGEKGVGLGLVLVKEFVEKNHGRLWVESTVGEGTVFSFSLKRSDV